MWRVSAPWAVLVLSICFCSVRLSTQIRLRINPNSLRYQRMKERHWEMKHKLTDIPEALKAKVAGMGAGIAKIAVEDVKDKPEAEKPDYEPKKIVKDPSVKETKIEHTDVNTPHDDTDATKKTRSAPSLKADSTNSVKFKSKRSRSALHGPTNETSSSNSSDPLQVTLDTIRLHVSQAVTLQRLLMKSLQNTSGLIAEGIVTLRKAQDVDANVVDKLVQAIKSTVTTGPESRKLHQLLKNKVEQALKEINTLNKATAKTSDASDADGVKPPMDAKQVFRKRNDILNALEQNQEAIAAFDELVSARLKLANSLTEAHNVTKQTLDDMTAQANSTQLEPRFNKIMLLGEHIKEAKATANAAVKSAIEERSEAEESVLKAGVQPLSDIKSDIDT